MLGSLGIGLGSGALASFFFKHFGRRSACFGAKRDEYVFVPSTRTFVKKEKAEKDPAAAAAAHGHGAEGGDGHGERRHDTVTTSLASGLQSSKSPSDSNRCGQATKRTPSTR